MATIYQSRPSGRLFLGYENRRRVATATTLPLVLDRRGPPPSNETKTPLTPLAIFEILFSLKGNVRCRPIMPWAMLHERLANWPEIRTFRAFDFVFRRPIHKSRGESRRMSPALFAKIPVSRRLAAETSSIRTATLLHPIPGNFYRGSRVRFLSMANYSARIAPALSGRRDPIALNCACGSGSQRSRRPTASGDTTSPTD